MINRISFLVYATTWWDVGVVVENGLGMSVEWICAPKEWKVVGIETF